MKTAYLKNSPDKYQIGKIVCIGRNYSEHAKELGNVVPEKPLIFLKPASAVIYSGGKIIYPEFSKEMHHEIELILLIGKTLKNVNLKEAEEGIIGYGVGLDMTLRDVQSDLKKKGHPWTIAKCFDTSAVISDFVLKENYKLSMEEEISLSVKGIIKQKEKLNKMIFSPAQIVEYISSLMILEKGDLIFTGTPAGVGKVEKGDELFGKINGIAEIYTSVG